MTRREIADLGSSKVRKDSALFSLFKTYITEDAAHIFADGRLPSGCFGCSFANNFRLWQAYVQKDENEKIIVMEGSKTYKLKSKSYRVYFKGSVLSDQSTDSQWLEWIQYASGSKRDERKEKFDTLPEALRPKKADKPEDEEKEARSEPEQKQAAAPKKKRPKKSK